MKIINIKKLYPFYTSDCFCEVSDEIAEQLKQFEKKDHAAYERRRVYGAYYSFDANDSIEGKIIMVLSPEEIYEQKLISKKLYAAINSLPKKQTQRIYAHFFLGMSKAEIARSEGVDAVSVRQSIQRGLKRIKKFLKSRKVF